MLEYEAGQERTEQPTQRRRDEAREQGQFAFSLELVNSLVLLAGAVAVWWGGSALVRNLQNELRVRYRQIPLEIDPQVAAALLSQVFGRGLELVGMIVAGLFVVGFGANVVQAGLRVTPDSLGPKWEKLNPVTGWRRIFSLQGTARGVWAIVRVILVTAVVWWVLRDREGQIASLAHGDLRHSVSTSWSVSSQLLLAVAGCLTSIGAADYAVQWYRNEKALMMTKQELREEQKEDEGDPLLRGQRRQRAREMVAQRRMLTEVPKATVVVTNPTHVAVALRYERGVTRAPVVVAKGRDAFALQIATKARRHGIPVVERKPLARALFKAAKVGQEIPQALYVAASEVLAYVYRLRGSAA